MELRPLASETSDLPPHVLLAEDDAALRTLVATAMRRWGYRVTELADGGELLDQIANNLRANGHVAGVDLIVSDIRMPKFTGLDVAVGLRRVLGVTPLILITAFSDDHTRDYARHLGVESLLDKPFRLDELRSALERALPSRG